MPVRSLLLVCIALATAGCGFSSQPVEPLVVGSQQYFTLDWGTTTRGAQRVVQGHVRNNWSLAATNLRLLVEGIEPPERVVSQRIIWVGGQLLPGTRASFETAIPPAPRYRVRVFAFDWVQSAEMVR